MVIALMRAFVLLASIACAGCTVIRVQHGVLEKAEVLPGIAKVVIAPGTRNLTVAEIQSFGFAMGATGTVLGWASERVMAFPVAGSCHLVLLENTADQVSQLVQLLKDSGVSPDKICSFTKVEGLEK